MQAPEAAPVTPPSATAAAAPPPAPPAPVSSADEGLKAGVEICQDDTQSNHVKQNPSEATQRRVPEIGRAHV